MGISGSKRLTTGGDGDTSTAVEKYEEPKAYVEYQEPKQVSSRKRKSSAYEEVNGSWRYRPSQTRRSSQRYKQATEAVIDAQYSDVITPSAKSLSPKSRKQLPSVQKIPSTQKRLPSGRKTVQAAQEPIKSPKVRRISSAAKRIDYDIGWVDESATQSPQKASKSATKAIVPSPAVRCPVAVSQADEKSEDLGEYVANRIKSGIRKDAKKAYKKFVAEPAAERKILKTAEQKAYNARHKELFNEKIKKAQEAGIHKAETTPFQRAGEKIAKVEKAAGKAIAEGIQDLDQAVTAFDRSQIAKNITRTNEATLKGMQAARVRAMGSIGASKATITRSALNKPRILGTTATTATTQTSSPKITTRILRRGKNDIVCYFDQFGRQISAAKAQALMAGAVVVPQTPQKATGDIHRHGAPFAPDHYYGSPIGNIRRQGTPFAVGEYYRAPFTVGGYYGNPIGDIHRHGTPFTVGEYYGAPFAVGGYYGNPIGDIHRHGNPLGDMRNHGAPFAPGNHYGNPLGQIRKEGNPIGNIRWVTGNPIGERRSGNPLGDDEKRGHTSRMVRMVRGIR